jgi:N-acetylglucosamine-6-phosphate deacetylase
MVGVNTRLRCRRLVAENGVLTDAVVVIEGSMITSVGSFTDVDLESPDKIEVVDGWVVPGFVDIHTHGGGGHDVGSADPDDAAQVAAFARRQGVTSMVASLVTAQLSRLVERLQVLGPLVDSGAIAGIHLEGPFLSAGKRGAHDPELLRAPDPESVDRLLEAADGRLSMVTIAPELPGGLDAVRRFVENGVTVAIGHTEADAEIVAAAVEAGARVATHLFNAMPSIHHRRPGPIPVLLNDPRITVELIMDGVHVHPQVLQMAVSAAGADRVAMITDAMVATGMNDGDYRLGDLAVTVDHGVARLQTEDGTLGSIAGSTLTMRQAFANAVQNLGLPIADVAAMAATTPARTLGLAARCGEDQGPQPVGVIAPRRRADLAVVDDNGELRRLMCAGSWEDLT